MDSNLLALALALVALATNLVAYLKDQWDTLHKQLVK
jgi:Flp pilus assembly pilin Flp